MKLESKVFRDAANIYLWDGISKEKYYGCEYSCYAIFRAAPTKNYFEPCHYKKFYKENFKPWFSGDIWWDVGWRFWTQAAVQRHRKKMLLKAADLVDKMNGESV